MGTVPHRGGRHEWAMPTHLTSCGRAFPSRRGWSAGNRFSVVTLGHRSCSCEHVDPRFSRVFESPHLQMRILKMFLLRVRAAPDGRSVLPGHLRAGRPAATVLVKPRLGPRLLAACLAIGHPSAARTSSPRRRAVWPFADGSGTSLRVS